MKKLLPVLSLLPTLAMAGHPLVSDDSGTQGTGRWQMELNTDRGRYETAGAGTTVQQINTTLTYGVTEDLDLALNLPWLEISPEALPGVRGPGDAALIAKWRIHDQDGWSWALKPQINLVSGDADSGLGNGRTGAALNSLFAVTRGPWTLLANVGATWNNNRTGARTALWNFSTAATFTPIEQLKLAIDVGTYQNADPANSVHPAFVLLGAVWSVHQSLDLDVGVKRGLNDSEVRHSLGAGITLHF